MSKTLVGVGSWSVGVLCCLAVVVGVSKVSPEEHENAVNRCEVSAVRTYPNIGGRELKIADLKDCQGLGDEDLNRVRADLQNFGVEAATRVAAGK